MMYAELISRSYFSLLDGGSSPEELFQAASAAGVSHLALADRDCVYGLVRAHRAAKECGVALINAASMTIREHPSLVLLVENQQGWRNLCRLITASRADQEKGKGALMKEQLLASAEGLSCLLRPGWTLEQARPLREAFEERLALAWSRSLSPRDQVHQDWAEKNSTQLGASIVATNDVICHAPERQAVADVLNCIRRRTTLERVGRQLRPNAERCILELQDFKIATKLTLMPLRRRRVSPHGVSLASTSFATTTHESSSQRAGPRLAGYVIYAIWGFRRATQSARQMP